MIAILLPALLGACNLLVSTDPWFRPEVERQALKPGLWVFGKEANCAFDAAAPAETWPECATPIIVRAHELLGLDRKDASEPTRGKHSDWTWQRLETVLAPGEPMILQILDCWGTEEKQDEAERKPLYCYLALRPLAHDETGDIARFEGWLVSCGPLDNNGDGRAHYVTKRPFPGLDLTENDCTARDEPALRNAARSSEALSKQNAISAYWVREGYR